MLAFPILPAVIGCLVFGISLANSIKCGIALTQHGHYGFFPWMARLQWTNTTDLSIGICTGTIVSPNYVLMAAHCNQPFHTVGFFGSPDYELAEQVNVVEKHSYEGFNPDVGDIALFKLEYPLELDGVKMAPICVGGTFHSDQLATIAGWGHQRLPTGVSSKGVCLYMDDDQGDVDVIIGHVKVVKGEECVNGDGSRAIANETIQICTKPDDAEAVHGDSGGPLMVQNGANGQWHQIGITSNGNCHFPKKGRYDPVIFTSINPYCDWIKLKTGGEVSC